MGLPDYLNDESPQKKSQKQEKRIAKKGFLTPGSGNKWHLKGDVSFDDVLVEAKRTDRKSFSLTEKILKKIFKEALQEGKEAGLEIEFKDYVVQGIVYRKANQKRRSK